MTVRVSIGALLFGAAVALAGPGGAGARPAATGGKLVVSGFDLTTRDYAHDGLYTLNADGSDLRQVTQSTEDGEPHWSPDGRWIAYETDSSDEDLVSIVHDDGTGNRVVGHGSRFGNSLVSPSPWSPDGRELAWSGCGGLCLLDLASGRQRSVGLGDGVPDGFAWSPDGRRLAAVDSSGRVLVLDATNGSVQVVVAPVGRSPAWSADGRELSFFVPQKLGWQQLVIVSPKGGARRVIANKTYGASWSPHGHRLLFDTRPPHDAADSVEVSDLVEGHAPRVVIADAGDAKWSPDGSQIVFIRSRWPGGGYYK
jgi:Tol biopolymer transport system component